MVAWLRTGALCVLLFGLAFCVRCYRLEDAPFSLDQSTVLWMALTALRGGYLPNHGLVSSFGAFQPPGLVWMVMPAVAASGGEPVAAMVWFAVLDAAGIALMVWAVATSFGVVPALVVGLLAALNSGDAQVAAWLWHPSLFAGAAGLLICGVLRLRRSGSRWWALALPLVPFGYGLVHYSGFIFGVIAMAGLEVRRWRELVLPTLVGAFISLILWGPYLVFEASRDWLDPRTLLFSGQGGSLGLLVRLLTGDLALIWMMPIALGIALLLTRLLPPVLAYVVTGLILAANLWMLPGLRDASVQTRDTLAVKRLAAQTGEPAPMPTLDRSWVPTIGALYLPSDPPYKVGADVAYLELIARH